MKITRQWSRFVTYSITTVLFSSAIGLVIADPPLSPKPPLLTVQKPKISLSVIKDIQRVRPGMTRADLDWLFTPDGGLFIAGPRAYIYRYAGVGVAAVDATGKPVLDKTTHKPVEYGEAIKIDVKFKPATGRVGGTVAGDGASYRRRSPYGSPDDVIVSVSAPYVAFENYN